MVVDEEEVARRQRLLLARVRRRKRRRGGRAVRGAPRLAVDGRGGHVALRLDAAGRRHLDAPRRADVLLRRLVIGVRRAADAVARVAAGADVGGAQAVGTSVRHERRGVHDCHGAGGHGLAVGRDGHGGRPLRGLERKLVRAVGSRVSVDCLLHEIRVSWIVHYKRLLKFRHPSCVARPQLLSWYSVGLLPREAVFFSRTTRPRLGCDVRNRPVA